jgi:DNA-binding LacI/PurR family transcriptional regulator
MLALAMTIKGIAKVSGVSHSTPPRVLHGYPGIPYKLEQQVETMMLHALNEETSSAKPQVSKLRGELIIRQTTAPPK